MQPTMFIILAIILSVLSTLIGEAIATRVADERKTLHRKGVILREKNTLQKYFFVIIVGTLIGTGIASKNLSLVQLGVVFAMLTGMMMENQRQAMRSGFMHTIISAIAFLVTTIL